MTAWRRETRASGRTRSFDGSRPIESNVRAREISRRLDDVGFRINFATERSTGAEGVLPQEAHLDRLPLLETGFEALLPNDLEHGLVHDVPRGLDDLEVGGEALFGDDPRHSHRYRVARPQLRRVLLRILRGVAFALL